MPPPTKATKACVLLLAVAACGAEPRVPRGGWGPESHAAPPPPAATRNPAPRLTLVPAAARRRWELAAELEGMRVAPGRSASEHGNGSAERTVMVNGAAEGYLELGAPRPLPEGALVVQRHHPPGSDAVAFVYAMHKRAPGYAPEQLDWEFLILDGQSRVAARGKLAPCARCHLEAPFDALFGPPAVEP